MSAAGLEDLVRTALPHRTIASSERIGQDSGVFSVVHRVVLDGAGSPPSVVVKQPDPGPNGAAAASSGAYQREAIAYRTVLPQSPVSAPGCWLIDEPGDQRASFVLDDLRPARLVDQLVGLSGTEAVAVVDQLAMLHRHWESAAGLDELGVRRATPGLFAPEALARGVRTVADRWTAGPGARAARSLGRLLERREPLVEAFRTAGPVTLCHGDPRADNVAFGAGGGAVLFDWQQLGRNIAQADLAWLAATSLEPEVRRAVEGELVERHAAAVGHDPTEAHHRYRLGMVLPGLAVLLLAQRELATPRAMRMVATSVRRISAAVDDLHVADLAA